VIFLERQVHIAAFGDEQRVADRLGDFREDAAHLLGRAEVVGRVGHPHAFFVVEARVGLDGEQDVLVLIILRLDVVDVVGGDKFRAVARAEFDEFAVQFEDFGDVVLLQFEEEAVGTEDVVIPVDALHGLFGVFVEDGLGDFGGHTARGGDQPFGVRGEEVVVYAGIVVHPLQLRGGRDLEQVFIARLVLRQQEEVGGTAVQFGVAVFHRASGHVGFDADDGFDARVFRRVEEFDHAEHRPVVRDGDRGHVHLFDARRQLLNVREAVKKRIVGVDVEVGERHSGAQ
jgi:hypothetical protein